MTEPIKTGENSWIITLEEDPDTGELVMPLPAEALESNGWQVGDVLNWKSAESGAWVLTRKTPDTE
jgi:hypothetical protein